MAKPNRWVDFIRKWAKDNDTSYSCALSNPKCKDAYRAKYGVRKAVPAKTERERMGLEDINREDRPLGFKRRGDGVLVSDLTAKEREKRFPKKSFKAQVEEVIAEAKAKPDKPKKKKLRIIEDEGVEFILPPEVRDRVVVAEPPKKKHKRRPPYEPYKDAEGLGLWDSLMKASQEGMERRGGGSFYRL